MASLESLDLVPAPLVDFGGRDMDLGTQCHNLGLTPVLVLGEGPMKDHVLRVGEPVFPLPRLATSRSICPPF